MYKRAIFSFPRSFLFPSLLSLRSFAVVFFFFATVVSRCVQLMQVQTTVHFDFWLVVNDLYLNYSCVFASFFFVICWVNLFSVRPSVQEWAVRCDEPDYTKLGIPFTRQPEQRV